MKSNKNLSRAERFFKGERVEYEAVRKGLSVKVFMQGARVNTWKYGVDYRYSGGVCIEDVNGGLETGASFYHNFQTFKGSGYLGELFDDANEKAACLRSAMRTAGSHFIPSVDTLTRCFFEIKDQAEGEFLQDKMHDGSNVRQDLWDKYFKPCMPEPTDD